MSNEPRDPSRRESGDPELDDLLSSFDDPRHTADGAPVPDMALDELLTMFDDPTARTARPASTGSGRATPMRWVADVTEPVARPGFDDDAFDDEFGDQTFDDGPLAGDGRVDASDAPVADVPVETGIDWLGAPVFADQPPADLDPTEPLDVSGSGPAPAAPRQPAPVDDTLVDDATGPMSPPAWRGDPLDRELDQTAPERSATRAAAFDPTLPDGLAARRDVEEDEPRHEPRVREVAIPVERVGVVAVDQETGEMLRSGGDEQLPTGKAFFGRTTIIITDDDAPDVGYLDDELAAPEPEPEPDLEPPELDPNTIYIGDKDEGFDGALERSPRNTARNGAIDPRIRARRSSVRREADRRRVFFVAVGVGLLTMLLVAVGVIASPMFGATDVRIEGAVYTDADVLDAVIADVEGDAVLLIDTGSIERRLEEVPWVERARVDARFPHTLVIDIRERRPLACFRGGDSKWRVIDVQGRVLDVLDGQPVAYMPISGNHPDTARGQFAGAPYASVATLVQVLPAEVRAITTSVGLDATTGTLTMELTGGVAVRLGSGDDLDDKLARLLSQVRRGGLDGVVSLDVSTAQIGVVRG